MLRASKKKSEMNIEKDLGLLSKKRIELNLISDRVDSFVILRDRFWLMFYNFITNIDSPFHSQYLIFNSPL